MKITTGIVIGIEIGNGIENVIGNVNNVIEVIAGERITGEMGETLEIIGIPEGIILGNAGLNLW